MVKLSKEQKLINQVGFIKTQLQDVSTKLEGMSLFEDAEISERLMDDCSALRERIIKIVDALPKHEAEGNE